MPGFIYIFLLLIKSVSGQFLYLCCPREKCLYNSRLLSDDAREPDSADICLYPPLTITQPLGH